MLRYLTYAAIAYVFWIIIRKIISLSFSSKRSAGHPQDPPIDVPQDHAYKNIEDADFEDITGDPGKPS